MRLNGRLQPRSSRDEVVGVGPKGELHVRVTVPPAEDAANKCLLNVLSKHGGIPSSRIAILSGHRSREKALERHGLTLEALADRGAS